MARAAIGIGSSLGDRVLTVRKAIAAINALDKTRVVNISDLYETLPVGGVASNKFINACAIIETELSPHELLLQMMHIERQLGRTIARKWSDRACDLDLLDYDNQVLDDPDCTLPHPLMAQRAFVLIPLSQIAPDLEHPVQRLTVTELTRRLTEADWAAVRHIDPREESSH